MLDLNSLVTPARTLCRCPATSKKRLFEQAAELISSNHPDLAASDVFAALLARERLGSTALGQGIAIPHCRIANCSTAVGTRITLAEAIDFDAPDRENVDILFVLLVPEEATQDHLNILAGLAELLSKPEYCQGLRAAESNAELHRFAVAGGQPA